MKYVSLFLQLNHFIEFFIQARTEDYPLSSSHPGHVIHTAAQVAALRSVSLEEVIRQTGANATKLYRLPPIPAHVEPVASPLVKTEMPVLEPEQPSLPIKAEPATQPACKSEQLDVSDIPLPQSEEAKPVFDFPELWTAPGLPERAVVKVEIKEESFSSSSEVSPTLLAPTKEEPASDDDAKADDDPYQADHEMTPEPQLPPQVDDKEKEKQEASTGQEVDAQGKERMDAEVEQAQMFVSRARLVSYSSATESE